VYIKVKREKNPRTGNKVTAKNNIAVRDLKIKSPNLEAVFLKLTGRTLRD